MSNPLTAVFGPCGAPRAALPRQTSVTTSAAQTHAQGGYTAAPEPSLYPPRPDELATVIFDVSDSNFHELVSQSSGRTIEVFYFRLWNATDAQDFRIMAGSLDCDAPLPNFPAQTGFELSLTGLPHYRISPGAGFGISGSAGGRYAGTVKYRYL